MSSLLRLATAGSVDDGKSTLVGRLLYDTKSVLADQLDAVQRASVDKGLSTPDLSLLVDGLRSEREQGITIDVAYRYFATPNRSFVLADTPGRQYAQYGHGCLHGTTAVPWWTRKEIVEQTSAMRPYSRFRRAALVLAVNKVDLIGYDEEAFTVIAKEFTAHATSLGYAERAVLAIPVSALRRQRITRVRRTPWPRGRPEHLETVPVTDDHTARLSISRACVMARTRCPTTAATPGRSRRARTSGGRGRRVPRATQQRRTHRHPFRPSREASGHVRDALLSDELDIARGDLLAAAGAHTPTVTDEFDATLCWLSTKPLTPGARVLVKHGTRTVQALVERLKSRFDEQTLATVDDLDSLELNEIASVRLRLSEEIPVDDYGHNPRTGAFLVIDPASGDTLAAGLVGERFTALGA